MNMSPSYDDSVALLHRVPHLAMWATNISSAFDDVMNHQESRPDPDSLGPSSWQENETDYTFDGDGHQVIEGVGTRSSPGTDPMVTAPIEYQVWSSVLGSSLATVYPNGDQLETKVFAGGTHVATLGQGVVFNAADPVTGTTGLFIGTEAVKEQETEPFGQTIESTNPGSNYPSNYEDVVGGAKEPEWECANARAMGSSFQAMPVHCQNEEALQEDFSIAEKFGFSIYEENPNKLAKLTDSPLNRLTLPDGGRSPSNMTLSYAETSTYKHSKEEIRLQESTPDCDVKSCVVNVENPDIPGFVDASVGGDGVNAALSDKAQKKVEKAIASIKNLKPSENCQKNVIDKLTALGFNLTDFQKYLEKGYNAFDITKSTVSVVDSLYTKDQAKVRGLSASDTISDTYKDIQQKDASGKIVSTVRTNAVTSISSGTFLTYLRPDAFGDDSRNSAWLFHEALHGFLTNGRTDSDIERALFRGNEKTDSKDITDYIRKNCF